MKTRQVFQHAKDRSFGHVAGLLFLCSFFLLSSRLPAQSPGLLSYQAVVRGTNQQPLVNQSVSFRFSILDTDQAVVYSETHIATTNNFGLVNLVIGESNPAAFSAIEWSTGNFSLRVEMDPAGGTSYIISETTPFRSVPYALYAEDADADMENEIITALVMNGNNLEITEGGITRSIDLGQFADQVLSYDATTHILSLEGGGTVDLTGLLNDADASPTNEMNTSFTFTGTTLSLTDPGSTKSVNLSALLDNTDSWSPKNDSIYFLKGSVGIGTNVMGSRLAVKGYGTDPEEPLFEVKRADGQTVFAIYNEGIRAYVDDSPTKGSKGGFAVGGFNPSKGVTNEYFRVSPDSVRVYIDETITKGSKGGFAVGGFSPGKSETNDLMYLNKDNYFIGHLSGSNITTGTYNTFFGYNAGLSNTSGSNNIFIGFRSGYFNLGASNNVFLGNAAGYNNNSGYSNIFLGINSGFSNTSGYRNVFIGENSGNSNTTGYFNTFIGYLAGESNTIGLRNTFMGYRSGRYNAGGNDNAFFGFQSGYYNTTGVSNAYFGHNSAFNNAEGSFNSFLGYGTGYNSQGSYNTYLGYMAGRSGTTVSPNGSQNVMIGYQTGYNNTTGNSNVFIGNLSGYTNSTGGWNTFLGYEAGYKNNASYNVFIGYRAGRENTSGTYNTFLGYESGAANTTGYENAFLGYQTGYYNTSGFRNVFIGWKAGRSNTLGTYNIFLGREAGMSNTEGSSNVYLGESSGQSNVLGTGNTFIGKSTGANQTSGGYNVYIGGQSAIYKTSGERNIHIGWHSGAYSAGDDNVLIGYFAGMTSVGSGNVFIGKQAGQNATGWANRLLIENSTNLTNPLIYGEFDNNRVAINNASPTQALDVNGNARFRGIGSAAYAGALNRASDGTLTTATSDIRMKENIETIQGALDAALLLRGVTFTWKSEPEMGKRIGLIAQEVEEVLPELVFTNETDGYKGVNYAEMTAVLIEALKEQQAQIQSQEERIRELEAMVKKMVEK